MTTWTNDELTRIDAAYNAKYGRYGATYIGPMLAARDTTLRLLPH